MEVFQAKFVVKDSQARHLSNPDVATKRFGRTERPFFKHRANCSRKIIHQGPSIPGIVKQIRSLLASQSRYLGWKPV
jgi:hypothetical protein